MLAAIVIDVMPLGDLALSRSVGFWPLVDTETTITSSTPDPTFVGGSVATNGTVEITGLGGDTSGITSLAGKVDVTNVGTRGRALDHIGFEVRDLPGFIARLEAAGIKTEGPMRKAGNGTTSIAFLTDPWGTYIELTEGLAPK